MTRRLPAAALALLLLTAACGGDGDDDAADTTTTAEADEATTTTTGPVADDTTTTAAPAEATTSTTAEPPLEEGDGPAIPTDPGEYATALIRAWEVGDVPTAEVFATDEAFDQLFAFEGVGTPGTWQLVGCDGAAGSSYCTFDAGGDPTLTVRVLNELAAQSAPDAVIEVVLQG